MTTRSCHWLRGSLAAAVASVCLAAPLHAQSTAPAPPAARAQAPAADAGSALVRPTFTPRHANGVYALGDTVAWTATLPSGAAPAPGGYLYKVRKNNLEILETGVLDFGKGPATDRRRRPRADDGLRRGHLARLRGRRGREDGRRRRAVEADTGGAAPRPTSTSSGTRS
jgi:hypothetical protein